MYNVDKNKLFIFCSLLKDLLNLNIKEWKNKVKFIVIVNKIDDLTDNKINLYAYYTFKSAKSLLNCCLCVEYIKVDEDIKDYANMNNKDNELFKMSIELKDLIIKVSNKYKLW